MDEVFIEALRIDTVIGVYPHERTQTQTLWLDLRFACDTQQACVHDSIETVVDYALIAQFIRDFAAAHQYYLVEAFATQLADNLQQQFALAWLRLTVRKPDALPDARAAGISLERGVAPPSAHS